VTDRWLAFRRFVIQSRNAGYLFGWAMKHQVRTPSSQRCELPAAPKGVTIYAIGDIHGRLDLLDTIHGEIEADRANSCRGRTAEIYLGDYIDRGPDSAGVISRLIVRSREVYAIFLRGNHEQMLLDFLAGEPCLEMWKGLGAIPCLLSYGLTPDLLSAAPQAQVRQTLASLLPAEHRQFLSDTAPYCETDCYLFVHAGVRPGIKLEKQSPDDLLGIRGAFLDFIGDHGRIVVHGHTPVLTPDFRPNRINIDTGAYARNCLTCLRIGEDGPRVLHSTGQVAIG
jgi:serine/threonine protein phosphatase 1